MYTPRPVVSNLTIINDLFFMKVSYTGTQMQHGLIYNTYNSMEHTDLGPLDTFAPFIFGDQTER